MAKAKSSVFFCQECGYESAKWMGQCPACHAWNTFVEEKLEKTTQAVKKLVKDVNVTTLDAIKMQECSGLCCEPVAVLVVVELRFVESGALPYEVLLLAPVLYPVACQFLVVIVPVEEVLLALYPFGHHTPRAQKHLVGNGHCGFTGAVLV